MAEIILSPDEDLQPQLRDLLDLATELEIGHSQVTSAPKSTTGTDALPHGITVTVPDELAEAYAERRAQRAAEAEKATKKRAPAKKAAAAQDKAPADQTPATGEGDGATPPKE